MGFMLSANASTIILAIAGAYRVFSREQKGHET